MDSICISHCSLYTSFYASRASKKPQQNQNQKKPRNLVAAWWLSLFVVYLSVLSFVDVWNSIVLMSKVTHN